MCNSNKTVGTARNLYLLREKNPETHLLYSLQLLAVHENGKNLILAFTLESRGSRSPSFDLLKNGNFLTWEA